MNAWWRHPQTLRDAIEMHGNPTQAARELGGISERRAREIWSEMNLDANSASSSEFTQTAPADPAEIVALKRKIDRLEAEKNSLAQQVKVSVKHANLVDDVAALVAPLKDDYPQVVSKADARKAKKRPRRGTPVEIVLYATDWHTGAQIHPDHVEQSNVFNGQVLAERVEHVEQVVAEWIENYESLHGVSRITYALVGDMVNNDGQLHPDQSFDYARVLAQALDASILLKQLITPQIKRGQNVRVVTTQGGNHGRSTRKMPSGPAAAQTSWDMVCYEHLAAMLHGSGAEMILGRNYSTTIDVAGKKVWLAHGDGVSGGGSENSVKKHTGAARDASLLRALAESDLSRVIDYCRIGHFHEPKSFGNVKVCPSIKGTGTWELEKLGKVQRPAQLLEVFHPHYGIIGAHEIDCSSPQGDGFVWGAMQSVDPACSLV